MKNMTWKQRQRQKGRSADGRYAEHNPCYRCGRSAGSDYFSGPYVDRADERGRKWNDEMLCVCRRCEEYLYNLAKQPDGLDRIYAEVDGPKWNQGRPGLPQGRSEA